MILYTEIPGVINNLITRLKGISTGEVELAITKIGIVSWYNLPFKLNQLVSVLKMFQETLLDENLLKLIEEIKVIYWYDLFNKVSLIVKASNLIEELSI
jgi:hypothetical protein